MANGCLFLLKNYNPPKIDNENGRMFLNLGYGKDYTIKSIANTVKKIVNYNGKIIWDTKRPDGTPKRLLDSSKVYKLGWKPKINFEDGIKLTYEWFLKNYKIEKK